MNARHAHHENARCSAVPVHSVLVIGQRRIEALPREMFRKKKRRKKTEQLKFSNNAGLCEDD